MIYVPLVLQRCECDSIAVTTHGFSICLKIDASLFFLDFYFFFKIFDFKNKGATMAAIMRAIEEIQIGENSRKRSGCYCYLIEQSLSL